MRQRSWGLFSLFIIVCLAVGQSANQSRQPRPSVPDTPNEEITVRLERQGWEALKAKDATTYERLLAEDFVRVGADGVTTKNGEKNDIDQLTMDTYSHMIPALRNEVASRIDEIFPTAVNEAVKTTVATVN